MDILVKGSEISYAAACTSGYCPMNGVSCPTNGCQLDCSCFPGRT